MVENIIKNRHDVQFYSTPSELYRSVSALVRRSLQAGLGVVVCLRQAHAEALRISFREGGFDYDQLCSSRQLTVLDSHQTLSLILRDGYPERAHFLAVVGDVLDGVRRAGFAGIQAYGEMVDVLWQRGESEAALRLEQLWNELIAVKNISLHCAYDLGHFKAAHAEGEFRKVCACHTDVAPTDHYMTLPLVDRLRYVAELQQKAASLEATRREAVLNLQRCKKLEAAKDRATRANEAKSGFVAAVSHEIRAPIGIIYGFSELLHEADLPLAERTSYAGTIMRHAEHLAKLVDDILDLAKVEAGKLAIERQVFCLADDVAEVLASFRQKAAEKQVAITLTYDSKQDLRVWSDRTRLRQILVNVVANAVKFTLRGQVAVSIEEECFDNERLMHIVVKDSGCGITAAAAKRLFQPFAQADASTSHNYGGTGLGLLLSRDMARLLGGDVVLVESQPGVGSTFRISIDAGSGGEVAAAELSSREQRCGSHDPSQAQLEGLRVLYADDMPDSRVLVNHILTQYGAHVETADNGAEAVSMAGRTTYDVVLMDLQMPVLNGHDAAALLRSNGFQKPIIALTAEAYDTSGVGIRGGCDLYLAKPFSQQELITALMSAQSRQ